MRFVDSNHRTDVFFAADATDFDVAATLLALCAYPEQRHHGSGGRANLFWNSIYYVISKGGRSVHPISGTPERRPTHRSAMAQLQRGFSNLYRFMQLHVAMHMSGAGGGALSLAPSRDLSRLTISIHFDEAGRMKAVDHPSPTSLADMLRFHQPVLGVGDSAEAGTGQHETAKTLSKRYLRPMLRVDHLLGPLWGEILTHHNPTKYGDWSARLLKSDPAWAIRALEQGRLLAPYKAQLARQRGFKSASTDRMIHFHLHRHVQLLPPRLFSQVP